MNKLVDPDSKLWFIISCIRRNGNKDSMAGVTLKQACKTNDPQAAKKALIHWAQYKFNQRQIFSIGDILPLINDQNMLQELRLLQNKLYKETDMAWSGKRLWQCIKAFKIKKTEAKKNSLNYLSLLNPKHLDMRKAD